VYTGRVLNETLPALRLCGIEDLIDRGGLVTGDTPYRKPDPGGLRVAFRGLGARRPLYVGDNVDDWRTVVRYRELGPEAGPPALFAGLLSGALRERSRSIFEGFGVDIVATDVRALLQYVNRRG
ncbi:MAG: hypothetical protein IRY95_09685, partial [Clostridia bacterium]|nr:hypothetical protein [Clostridia bacterium]